MVQLCHFKRMMYLIEVTFTRITFMSPFSPHYGLRAAKDQMKNKIFKTEINGSDFSNHET